MWRVCSVWCVGNVEGVWEVCGVCYIGPGTFNIMFNII